MTGASTEEVGRWRALGLLSGAGERYAPDAVERIRLIQYAERRGLTADDIVDACRTQVDVLAGVKLGCKHTVRTDPKRSGAQSDYFACGRQPERSLGL